MSVSSFTLSGARSAESKGAHHGAAQDRAPFDFGLRPSLRVYGLVLLALCCASPAWADALQMEYDYGLTQGQLEAALLLYYTPLTGTQVLGAPKPYAPGTRSDAFEAFIDARLQLFDRWTTIVRMPYDVTRFENRRYTQWAWGPGDLEWSNQVRLLGDREYESLVVGAGLKFPTGPQGLGLGTGTTDFSVSLLVHQFFDPFFDVHLQLEYDRAVLGVQPGATANAFVHNAGISAQLGHDWTVIAEVLGTWVPPEAAGTGSYLLQLAPGVMYQLRDEELWVALSAMIPVVQTGDFEEVYPVSVNLSLYLDLDVF